GYFVIPYTIGHYLASQTLEPVGEDHPAFQAAENQVHTQIKRLLAINGKRSPASFHKELGLLLWDKCGMARNREGLQEALRQIPAIREEFWQNVNVLGQAGEFNQQLERAGRVADF